MTRFIWVSVSTDLNADTVVRLFVLTSIVVSTFLHISEPAGTFPRYKIFTTTPPRILPAVPAERKTHVRERDKLVRDADRAVGDALHRCVSLGLMFPQSNGYQLHVCRARHGRHVIKRRESGLRAFLRHRVKLPLTVTAAVTGVQR